MPSQQLSRSNSIWFPLGWRSMKSADWSFIDPWAVKKAAVLPLWTGSSCLAANKMAGIMSLRLCNSELFRRRLLMISSPQLSSAQSFRDRSLVIYLPSLRPRLDLCWQEERTLQARKNKNIWINLAFALLVRYLLELIKKQWQSRKLAGREREIEGERRERRERLWSERK